MTNHSSTAGYNIGDVARSCDIDPSHAADAESKRAVSLLKVGDPVFIRRSDKVWRYAVVADTSGKADNPPYILFAVSADGSTKKVGDHHWGDRIRPLKQQRKSTSASRFRRSRNPAYIKEKHLHSSCDTETTTPYYSSQGSLDLERSTSDLRRCAAVAEEKSSETGSAVTDHEPRVSFVRGQQDPPASPMKRRTSIKDKATDILRRFSGDKRQEHQRCDVHLNVLSDDILGGDDNMKIHEFEACCPDDKDIEVPQESTEPSSTEPSQEEGEEAQVAEETQAAAPRTTQRRPNSRRNRRNRGSFTLTTSGLFKNMMKGANVLGDESDGVPSTAMVRRNTVGSIDTSGHNNNEDGAAATSALKGYKPRSRKSAAGRQRRVTIASSDGQCASAPTASVIYRGAFAQLMEEKAKE